MGRVSVGIGVCECVYPCMDVGVWEEEEMGSGGGLEDSQTTIVAY
jgi:hypothetical protein